MRPLQASKVVVNLVSVYVWAAHVFVVGSPGLKAVPQGLQRATISSVLYYLALLIKEKSYAMGACACGYTTDPEKNCNGTHKVVAAVKADLAKKLEENGFPHAAEYVRNN